MLVLAIPVLFGLVFAMSACVWVVPLALARSRGLFFRHTEVWRRRVLERGSAYRSGWRIETPRPFAVELLDIAALVAAYAAPCVVPAALAAGGGILLAFAAAPLIVLASLRLSRFAEALPARCVTSRTRARRWALCIGLLGALALVTLAQRTPRGDDVNFVFLVSSWVGCLLVVATSALTVWLWPYGARVARATEARLRAMAALESSSSKPVIWRAALCACAAFGGAALSVF